MHGAVRSHADPLAPWSPLTPCELPKGPPQTLLHIGIPQPLSGAAYCAWDCHPWMSYKIPGRKPANAENCSGHAQFSPRPASSDTFPADGGSRPTLWMDLKKLLQSCVSFPGRRSRLGCSAFIFQDLKPCLGKPDDFRCFFFYTLESERLMCTHSLLSAGKPLCRPVFSFHSNGL